MQSTAESDPSSFHLHQKIKKYKNIIKTHDQLRHRPVPATPIQKGLPVKHRLRASPKSRLTLSIIYRPTHAEAQTFRSTTAIQTENTSTFCTLLRARAEVNEVWRDWTQKQPTTLQWKPANPLSSALSSSAWMHHTSATATWHLTRQAAHRQIEGSACLGPHSNLLITL